MRRGRRLVGGVGGCVVGHWASGATDPVVIAPTLRRGPRGVGHPTRAHGGPYDAVVAGQDPVVPSGERTRLEALVRDHGAAVANFLRRRLYPLSTAELDDLVEETFVVLWRRAHAVPTGDAERPWVLGVARHVLHNAHRSHRRRVVRESGLRAPRPSASAEDEAISDLAARDALASLSSTDRELLQLHFFDGLSVTQLGVLLGVTPNAAGTRLSRAKTRFVERLAALDPGTAEGSADISTTWSEEDDAP